MKGAKTLLHANQTDGFDCPGCAWPDRDHRSTFEFCENGAKAVAAEATAQGEPRRKSLARSTLTEWASVSDYDLEATGRLTEPLVYDAQTDRYQRTTWDTAFALIARELQALPDPNQAIFYTSGRTSNEAAFLYQLFVREYGTNNFPDCSNMCHEPSGSGAQADHRRGQGHGDAGGLRAGRLHLRVRPEPGHQPPAHAGRAAHAARKRGARIVSFNPLARARAWSALPTRRTRWRWPRWATRRSAATTSSSRWAATWRCSRACASAWSNPGGVLDRRLHRRAHDRL